MTDIDKGKRATCWSITINNPTTADLNVTFPNNKWKMVGQMEKGSEGTEHYQGMLTTPQVRFSAVKKILPRAHIEVAKNRNALEKYVSKTDTRVATVEDITSNIPTLFDYQHTIANKWDDNEFDKYVESFNDKEFNKLGLNNIALRYVDRLVERDITAGVCGIEYIAINPMWRSAWKRFWRSMVTREHLLRKNSTVEYIDGIQVQTRSQISEEEYGSQNGEGEDYGDNQTCVSSETSSEKEC